jgi:hypothetical protein
MLTGVNGDLTYQQMASLQWAVACLQTNAPEPVGFRILDSAPGRGILATFCDCHAQRPAGFSLYGYSLTDYCVL